VLFASKVADIASPGMTSLLRARCVAISACNISVSLTAVRETWVWYPNWY
jgi:hypothetical protein